MRRCVSLLALVALGATAGAACSDVPAPSSKGNRAIGIEEQDIAEAKPPPEVEKGVVPDLVGVSVADSKDALAEAGFRTGTLDTTGLFGTVSNDMVVCEQDPAAGASPKGETKVDLIADRQC